MEGREGGGLVLERPQRPHTPTSHHATHTHTHSLPHSGPMRYDLVGGRWIYARDGHDMVERLRDELSAIVGDAPPL